MKSVGLHLLEGRSAARRREGTSERASGGANEGERRFLNGEDFLDRGASRTGKLNGNTGKGAARNDSSTLEGDVSRFRFCGNAGKCNGKVREKGISMYVYIHTCIHIVYITHIRTHIYTNR